MTYARQQNTLERLERETLSEIRAIEDAGKEALDRIWKRTINVLRDDVAREYRRHFVRSTWNIIEATRYGTLQRIDIITRRRLQMFHEASVRVTSLVLRDIYRSGVLRNVWMLDQTTPPNVKVAYPRSPLFLMEADSVYRGPDSDTAWKLRWSTWLDSYRQNLAQNLRLGAINESQLDDAMDEVEATRVGSPSTDVFTALLRVYTTQSQSTYTMAENDVREINPDLGIEEIWQTRYYQRVCDFCDTQRGLTRDEAESDIPAHPYCGCYWRMVPKSWASLLRSGDESDLELAKTMDTRGIVSNAMVVRNDAGEPIGHVIVKFSSWVQGQQQTISNK